MYSKLKSCARQVGPTLLPEGYLSIYHSIKGRARWNGQERSPEDMDKHPGRCKCVVQASNHSRFLLLSYFCVDLAACFCLVFWFCCWRFVFLQFLNPRARRRLWSSKSHTNFGVYQRPEGLSFQSKFVANQTGGLPSPSPTMPRRRTGEKHRWASRTAKHGNYLSNKCMSIPIS